MLFRLIEQGIKLFDTKYLQKRNNDPDMGQIVL